MTLGTHCRYIYVSDDTTVVILTSDLSYSKF